MARVVVSEFLTLDGVMQAPGDTDEDRREGFSYGGWQLARPDEVVGESVMGGLTSAGGLLLGRRTYELFAGYWPNQPDDNPVAPAINALPKYVASRTLEAPLEWEGSTLLMDVAADVQRLREQDGGDILVIGSGNLVGSLVADGLVDAFQVMVYPLVLGTGRRLFAEGIGKLELRLVESRTTPNGIVLLTYEPAPSEDAAGLADAQGPV